MEELDGIGRVYRNRLFNVQFSGFTLVVLELTHGGISIDWIVLGEMFPHNVNVMASLVQSGMFFCFVGVNCDNLI